MTATPVPTDFWASPIYRFRVPDSAKPKGNHLIEVVFDVTLSAPSFNEPSDAMKEVLTKVTREYLEPGARILDFGAGKLRNALFLLRRGFTVFGVEFSKVFHTPKGKEAYKTARDKHRRFWTLVYPNEFLSNRTRFDLAIFINALNIMPVPSERLFAIHQSYKKLNAGGYLLWYSQYGDSAYKKRCTDGVRFGDGYYIGKHRLFKTFYREFSDAEMDAIMLANGFEFVRSFSVPHNHVKLYRKAAIPPVTLPVTLDDLQKEIPRDVPIEDPKKKSPKRVKRSKTLVEVRPDPPSLSMEERSINGLKATPAGKNYAAKYHTLIVGILKNLFMPQYLRRIKKEFAIDEGRKRIDILCPTGDEGFFHRLDSQYHIPSPLIIIECKNYNKDISNPEFDQLTGRLTPGRGMFGMIVCRGNDDPKGALKRCRDARKRNLTIIVLEDADVEALLRLRLKGDMAAIDDYLEDKLLEVID